MNGSYKRVILKLSGEALSGGKGHGLDDKTINNICSKIVEISKRDVQIAIVVGGGITGEVNPVP